ncbi:MAG: serine O-acetyltransferase [Deltaproteobacteria bacterium]|nr:serine O-acetyltransferase [Deltaproteobacteria bacterium]
MYQRIKEDVRTVFKKDPAAGGVIEVLTCYPGLHAVWMYRVAHFLWKKNWRLCARLISHFARFLTNIEIHPGAVIGRRFFIDHGAGVVIGETSEIGDDVLMYHGVLLGGVTLQKKKRHPTIGNNVMIGAGTIILGPVHIGDGARIGAASLVIKDVPECAVAIGVPARLGMGFSGKVLQEMTENRLPDPIADAFRFVGRQLETIENRLTGVEKSQGITAENRGDMDENRGERQRIFSPFDEEFINGTGI